MGVAGGGGGRYHRTRRAPVVSCWWSPTTTSSTDHRGRKMPWYIAKCGVRKGKTLKQPHPPLQTPGNGLWRGIRAVGEDSQPQDLTMISAR